MTIGLSHRLRLAHPSTYLLWCPGCRTVHALEVGQRADYDKHLGFDGDVWRPSFDPGVKFVTEQGLCHFELRAGVLHFFTDSWHDAAGHSVELPSFPAPGGSP